MLAGFPLLPSRNPLGAGKAILPHQPGSGQGTAPRPPALHPPAGLALPGGPFRS